MEYTKGEWQARRSDKFQPYNVAIRGKYGLEPTICTLVAVGKQPIEERHNAYLIVTAVNGCISVNRDNPQSVAESIKDMYEALKDLVTNGCSSTRAEKALAKAEGKASLQ